MLCAHYAFIYFSFIDFKHQLLLLLLKCRIAINISLHLDDLYRKNIFPIEHKHLQVKRYTFARHSIIEIQEGNQNSK
jgi:hypothetical protein